MNTTDDAFVHHQLATWQRRIQQTSADLVTPQTGNAQAAFGPLLQQLVSVYNLSTLLLVHLRQSAESPLATTDTGRAYLVQLATALDHTNRAATHLSTAVTGLADAHRHTPHPGTAAPVESQLSITLGHAAALRSLQRALAAVTGPLADPPPATETSSMPVTGEQHQRAADPSGARPVRRRP
ncbi:hypothetical protein ACFYXF_03925 [Streptomyces sp. NPDC002680]|uniref:hypothetical protein n=1 Tax=Streptomyces sp. NPDC002680 TaxID=3364659 RepID=UPI0036B1F2D7